MCPAPDNTDSSGPVLTRNKLTRFTPHRFCRYTHAAFGLVCFAMILGIIGIANGRLLLASVCLIVLVAAAWNLTHWLTKNKLKDNRASSAPVRNAYQLEEAESTLRGEDLRQRPEIRYTTPDLPTGRGIRYFAAYDKVTDPDQPPTYSIWVTRPWIARAAVAADLLVLTWLTIGVVPFLLEQPTADEFMGEFTSGAILANLFGFLVVVALEVLHWKAARKVDLTATADLRKKDTQ